MDGEEIKALLAGDQTPILLMIYNKVGVIDERTANLQSLERSHVELKGKVKTLQDKQEDHEEFCEGRCKKLDDNEKKTDEVYNWFKSYKYLSAGVAIIVCAAAIVWGVSTLTKAGV